MCLKKDNSRVDNEPGETKAKETLTVTRTNIVEYLLKTWDFLTGMVVPRLMSDVMTPPAVSMPSESGATSSKRTSLVASAASPLKIPPWTAAP